MGGNSLHPSVRNLPLSDKRVRHALTEMIESFTTSAKGRKIIKPVSLERGDKRRKETGFVWMGFNHIIDRIWFVESDFDGTYYGYEGIGSGYGRGIADSETNYIVTQILDECKERRIGFKDEIHPSDILRSLEFLEQSEIEAKIILVDIKNHLQLWRYRNLMARGQLRVPMAFSGYNRDIEIHFFRGMPEGTSIITDPEKLGELLIKQSIEQVARISDIENSEREETLRDIPSMTPEMLYEKVRLLAYETVKVNIINPKAAVILQEEKAGSSEEVKII
jgi:hypothetical protein